MSRKSNLYKILAVMLISALAVAPAVQVNADNVDPVPSEENAVAEGSVSESGGIETVIEEQQVQAEEPAISSDNNAVQVSEQKTTEESAPEEKPAEDESVLTEESETSESTSETEKVEEEDSVFMAEKVTAEEPVIIPETDLTEETNSVNEQMTYAEEPASESEPAVAIEPARCVKSVMTSGTASEPKMAQAAAGDASTATYKFQVGNMEYSGEADVVSGWNDETGTGWAYLHDDRSFVMVDFDGSGIDLKFNNTVNIIAAGLNRLRSLISSAVVNLSGTGILQVDNIQLNKDSDLKIHSDSTDYADGGVAVFEKDSELSKANNSVYKMNNGGVTGVLEESYSIPTGTTYVVPEGESLLLTRVIILVNTETGEAVAYCGDLPDLDGWEWDTRTQTDGALVIPEGSALKIEDGGKISLQTSSVWYFEGMDVYNSTLSVEGNLTVDGQIEGDGIVTIQGSASAEGSGTIKADHINIYSPSALKGDIVWSVRDKNDVRSYIILSGNGTAEKLYLSDARLKMEEAGIILNDLIVKDDSMIITKDPVTIKNICVDSGKTLSFYSFYEDTPNIDHPGYVCESINAIIAGRVTGEGKIDFNSGYYVLGEDSKIPSASSISHTSGFPYIVNRSELETSPMNVPFLYSPSQALKQRIPEDGKEGSAVSIPMEKVIIGVDACVEGERKSSIVKLVDDTSIVPESLEVSWNKDEKRYTGKNGKPVNDLIREYAAQLFSTTFMDYTENNYLYGESDNYVELFYAKGSGNDCQISIKTIPEEKLDELGNYPCTDLFLVRFCNDSFLNIRGVSPGGAVTALANTYTGSGRLGTLVADISEDDLEEGTLIPDIQEPVQPDNTGTGEEIDPGTGSIDNSEDSGPVIPDDVIPDPQPSLPEEADPDTAQGTGTGVLTEASLYRTVSVSFEVPEEWIWTWGDAWMEKLLFVVFRDPEGNLVAFPAEYDPQTKMLTFTTDMQGDYVVICLDPDEIEGELYSDKFYDELEKREDIQKVLPANHD